MPRSDYLKKNKQHFIQSNISSNKSEQFNDSLKYEFEKTYKNTKEKKNQQVLNRLFDKLDSLYKERDKKNTEEMNSISLKEHMKRGSQCYEHKKQTNKENNYTEQTLKTDFKSNILSSHRESSFIKPVCNTKEENHLLESSGKGSIENINSLPFYVSLFSMDTLNEKQTERCDTHGKIKKIGNIEKDQTIGKSRKIEKGENEKTNAFIYSEHTKKNLNTIYNQRSDKYLNERHIFSTDSANFDEDIYEKKLLKQNFDYIKILNENNSFSSLSTISIPHKEDTFLEKMKMLKTQIIKNTHYLPCILCSEYFFKLENITDEEFSILGNNETMRAENFVCTVCKHKRNMMHKLEKYVLAKQKAKEKREEKEKQQKEESSNHDPINAKREMEQMKSWVESSDQQYEQMYNTLFSKKNSNEMMNSFKKENMRSDNLQKNERNWFDSDLLHNIMNSSNISKKTKKGIDREEQTSESHLSYDYQNHFCEKIPMPYDNDNNVEQTRENIISAKDKNSNTSENINKSNFIQKQTMKRKPEKYYNALFLKELYNNDTNEKHITRSEPKSQINSSTRTYNKISSDNSYTWNIHNNSQDIKRNKTYDEQLLNLKHLNFDNPNNNNERMNFDKEELYFAQFEDDDFLCKHLKQKYDHDLMLDKEKDFQFDDLNEEPINNENIQFRETIFDNLCKMSLGENKDAFIKDTLEEQEQLTNLEKLLSKKKNAEKTNIHLNESSYDDIFKEYENYSNSNVPLNTFEYETDSLDNLIKKEKRYTLIKNGFNKLKNI